MGKPTDTTNTEAAQALTTPSGSGSQKLYEITAMVSYAVVIRADSKEDALKHVETWEQAWAENGEVLEAYDIDLHDVREGNAEQAHLDISSQNTMDIISLLINMAVLGALAGCVLGFGIIIAQGMRESTDSAGRHVSGKRLLLLFSPLLLAAAAALVWAFTL